MKGAFAIAFVCAGFLSMHGIRAQPVEGRVYDSVTGQRLAFVNIVYTGGGQGTVSNIDGEFRIASRDQVEFLKFSYLGYRIKSMDKAEIRPGRPLQVSLERIAYDIREVQIQPGINPAHRIINLALENRDRNNPEKMNSFSYTAYNKMYFTLDLESMHGEETAGGSDLEELEDFLEDNHLFLMEFVSDREFLHPDRNREVVTASRISGLKDPSFTLLATQIQSFSFYNELFMIWDRHYLNPISRGSTRKYLFILEDTMYTERMDTLFVISFRPLRGKNFDGLQGILHINSNGYAIQNVIAEAAENKGDFRIRIQQKYEFIDQRQWFPVQLNTDLMIRPANARVNRQPVALKGIGKSYLSDIRLDPDLGRRDFSHIELEVQGDAHKKDDAYWQEHRVNTLTRKDTNTYHLIDSIGREANLDRALQIFETIATGYIPLGFLNLDYQSLIQWNRYEGFRLGAALETNERISRWIRLGGKFAYGTRDGALKYGGHLRVNLNRRNDAFLAFRYNKDVVESAGWTFIEKPPITSSEIFRSFLIANKDKIEEMEVELQFPALRYLKVNVWLSQQERQVTTDYRYRVTRPEGEQLAGRFAITETGLMLKYAYKEKFMETPRGNLISLGTDYPVIYANLHRGIPLLGGDYKYTKLTGKITKTFVSKSLGETRLALVGSWVDRGLPYPLLYDGAGSYGAFTIETENSFATMRMNEFTSDVFASVHLRQNFGNLLFRTERFRPEIVLAASAGYGELRHDERHVNLEPSTLEKGYYESGILFNNLLRQWIFGYGLGVFYRFGPYSLPETIDNFAFKFTLRFNL